MGTGLSGASLCSGTAKGAVQTPTIPLAEIRQIIPTGFALTTGMTSLRWPKSQRKI